MRKQATNDFEKKTYKLVSNASFGRTTENLRKRSNVKFVSNPQQAEAFAQGAPLKSLQIIRHDLVCVSFKDSSVIWTIHDLSKLSLYKFHCQEMVPRYSFSQLKVAYKDTDLLLYLIEMPDLYNDMASFKHLLDLSDYRKKTLCMIQQTKKYH